MLIVGWLWFFFGVFGGGMVATVVSERRDIPDEQAVAAGIVTAVFLPLVLIGAVGFGLYKAIPFLGRGFAGLYRRAVPAKVKLPKAQVHEAR